MFDLSYYKDLGVLLFEIWNRVAKKKVRLIHTSG